MQAFELLLGIRRKTGAHQPVGLTPSSAARSIFSAPFEAESRPLTVHVRGTNFQLAVWRTLLRVPPIEKEWACEGDLVESMRESIDTNCDAKAPNPHFWPYPPETRLPHYIAAPYISLQPGANHAPESHTTQGTEHD